MLKLQNISKTFNENTVNQKIIFDDFNFSIDEGEFVVIIGSNGSGKSTLMNLISGKLAADAGTIQIGGVDVSNQPEYVRAKQVGRVFQDPLMGTAADMRIYENLAMASKKGKKPSKTKKRIRKSEYRGKTLELELWTIDRLYELENAGISEAVEINFSEDFHFSGSRSERFHPFVSASLNIEF